MVLQFYRTGHFVAYCYGSVETAEAIRIAKESLADGNYDVVRYEADFFSCLGEIQVCDKLNHKCIGGPFEFDEYEDHDFVDSDFDQVGIRFTAKQSCLVFANGDETGDFAATIASVAALSDDISQSILVQKDPNAQRWTISAPEGVPMSALIDVAKNMYPGIPKRAANIVLYPNEGIG